MSNATIRRLLETQLNAATPTTIKTSFENMAFTPTAGTLWQRAELLPAAPIDPELGNSHLRRDMGIFQVTVYGPKNAGSAEVQARIAALRDAFPRGLSLTSAGVLLRLLQSPSVSAAIPNDAWHQVAFSVVYTADVTI